MSKAILRRNSSKAGLQNLLTVTAQRSIEDAEEVERERRRRARESFRRTSSGGPGGECSLDNGTPAEEEDHDSTYDGSLKPSSSPSLEEDEGFSDWTQRREKRRQQRMQELCQEPEEEKRRQQRMQELSQEPEEDEEKALPNGAQTTSTTSRGGGGGGLQDLKTPTATLTTSSSKRLHRQHREQEEEEKTRTSSERRKELEEEEEAAFRAEQARREKKEREAGEQRTREEQRRATKKMEELQKSQAEVEKRKEVKVSYTSKVFLHQEAKPSSIAGHRDTAREDVTSSCNNNKSKRPSGNRVAVQTVVPDQPEVVVPETEQRLEKIRRSHQEKESQEMEQLRHRQVEAEQELEELKKRRGERRRVREDEERRREEDDQHRLVKEEEEKRRMKGDMEKRRQEAAERMKVFSSSVDGDEMMLSAFSPKSPILKKGNEDVPTAESTCSITERTQSLNRSLKKSNSFKKTHPPVLLTKIDDKREQYTHAVENSQEAKAVKQGVMDINSPPEAVSSKKNLFEGGEVWIQSPTKGTSCKDTEDLKVGVADLITQWVKGNPDGSGKQSPSRPADVKPGDVMNKKNMWEIISDTSGRTGQKTSGSPAGKKYKFVVTGHGKYEKKPDDNGEEYPNGQSDLCQDDY